MERGILRAACLLLLSLYAVSAHAASEREYKSLLLFFEEKELAFSPTRHEKPVSQTSENITVITERDIELMNAHTVADVLGHVPGVQLDTRGGLGSADNISIQGSDFSQVLVMIDGIMLNNLSDFFPDVGAIPVQHIERIEIIKGPASSTWGSSLGGVINIITKPAGEGRTKETVYASYGEKDTADLRAEASGKAGPVGYYLSAGRLQTDGLTPNFDFENTNFYSEFRGDLSKRTYLTLTFGYRDGSRGMGQDPAFDLSFEEDFKYVFSTLSLNSALSDKVDLEISLRTLRQDNDIFLNQLSTGNEISRSVNKDTTEGGSLKLVSRLGPHTLLFGADYDDGKMESNVITGGEQSLRRSAVYANDTIRFDNLSITPGLRYDDISTSGDFVSPSLGVTYSLGKNHLFRLAVARGFNTPPLSATFGSELFFANPNPDLKVEKVWSYQAGFESIISKYLWFKATAFRHDVDDAIVDERQPDGTFTMVNKDKIRRKGFEIEVETVPVHNFSLKTGYIYQDVENLKTDEPVQDVAEYTVDIALKYDDRKSLKALLLGHYIWWNPGPSRDGKYNTFIWDLNINKKILRRNEQSAEIFLTVHNLFDGSQYLSSTFKSPGRRWIEGGLRFRL
jgi:vitamin B12 transporter